MFTTHCCFMVTHMVTGDTAILAVSVNMLTVITGAQFVVGAALMRTVPTNGMHGTTGNRCCVHWVGAWSHQRDCGKKNSLLTTPMHALPTLTRTNTDRPARNLELFAPHTRVCSRNARMCVHHALFFHRDSHFHWWY